MLYIIAGVVAMVAWLILGRECLLIFAGLVFVAGNIHGLANIMWDMWETTKNGGKEK